MLEQGTLVFEMELSSIGIPFKTNIKQTLFKVLVTLKTLLLPTISFLRIICNAITFPKPEYINIFPFV